MNSLSKILHSNHLLVKFEFYGFCKQNLNFLL